MSNNKLTRIVILFIISAVSILTSSYVYYKNNTPTMPECRAILKMDISDSRSNLSGYYLFSIIPNDASQGDYSLLMNGQVNFNGKEYNISRKYLFEYHLQGEHFFTRIKNISIDPNDQAGENNHIRGVPTVGQIYLVKVKKLNDKNYIFEENYAPLFICTI